METAMDNASSRLSLQAFSQEIADLVRVVGQSIVGVQSHRSRGSGFVWRPGLIVTADETITDEDHLVVVLPGGETVLATLKGRDPSTDIALLRIEGSDLQPALASSAAVETGSLAIVVGASEGTPVAALGLVSHAGSAWRSVRGGNIDARIEMDMVLRASAEGGLAFDAKGRAIGMAVFGPRRRVLVIPSATIDRVAARLDADGRIARGYLGLGLQAVRIEGNGVGAMVMSVDAAGPGARSGLRQGDVIVNWNGHAVQGVNAILRELGPDSAGTMVRLSVTRGGEPLELDVTIGARPDR
jgi:S1-C subfamily serine protease